MERAWHRVHPANSGTVLGQIYSHPNLTIVSGMIRDRPIIEELLQTTKDITVLAPVDESFNDHRPSPDPEHITDIIMYHIFHGIFQYHEFKDGQLLDSFLALETLGGYDQQLKVLLDSNGPAFNGHIRISEPDLAASNGVLHLLTHFVHPPPSIRAMATLGAKHYAAFLLALRRAGLDTLLANQFQLTAYAPTNSAWKKVPLRTLLYLFSPLGNSDLVLLMLGHLSPVLVYSSDILSHPESFLVVPTLGKPLSLRVLDGAVDVNEGEALVSHRDVCGENGVLHGLDSVLGLATISRSVDKHLQHIAADSAEAWKEEEWYQSFVSTEMHAPAQDKQSLEYIVKSLIAGGIAGSAAKTVVAPLDRVKILFQTNHSLYVPYQGHSATLLRIFPYAGIKFMMYEQFKVYIMPSKEYETGKRKFVAGSLAGCASVICTYPFDLVRVRLAFETGKKSGLGISGICRAIFQERSPVDRLQTTAVVPPFLRGMANFYRGLVPSLLGMIPYAGVSFYTYESLKEKAKTLDFCLSPSQPAQLSYWATLACGAVSGMMAQTCSYPFEVVRRHMQVSSRTGNVLHSSMWGTAGDILQRRGVKGLFVGLGIGFLKVPAAGSL
ncbi:hypothetical protein HDU91_005132 [Kappamyces sp. JEL0680]|nr:hypothetical protein HDU91_005132 [Kappamyces sp. JEL0680]